MTTASRTGFLRIAIRLLIAGGLLLSALSGFAQSPIPADAGANVEMLENRIREVEASDELNPATKTLLLELYRQAIGFDQEARAHEEARQRYAQAREEAPEQARAVREELTKLESTALSLPTEDWLGQPLPELEQQLLIEKAGLSAVKGRLSELDELLEFQNPSANQAREDLTDVKTRMGALADELKAPEREGDSPQISEARRWALQNEAKSLSARVQRLDQQLLSQPMRFELLQAQSDMAALEQKRLESRVEALQAIVVERRREDAETARDETREAERQTIGKHPLVQQLAEMNAQLGEQLKKQAADLEKVNKLEARAGEQAKLISDDFRTARQKLEIAGLSQALGQALLEQSGNLPEAADFRKARRAREALLVESNLRQIRHQQERGRLRDIVGYVDELLAGEQTTDTEQERLRGELTSLAEARRVLVDKAIAADDTYLQALSELEHAQRQLSEATAAYGAFLDERLLWIRSGEPPSWETLQSIPRSLAIFGSLENWRELARAFVQPNAFPWILLIGLSVFAVLLWKARAMRRALRRSGQRVGELRHDRLAYTAWAMGWTVALALPWPLFFVTLGMHLQPIDEIGALIQPRFFTESSAWGGQFVPSVGAAFFFIALLAFNFAVFRLVCKPTGVAVVHFGWNAQNTALLRHEIRRLMFVIVPTGFVLFATVVYEPGSFGGGLSRLCVVAVMIALVFFFGRTLAPATGALSNYYAENPRRWFSMLRYLWFGLGLAMPVALAVLSVIGYVYTAGVFLSLLLDTLWLLLSLIFVHQLIVRWLLLTERRLAFRAALERHHAMRAAREAQEQEGAAETTLPPFEEQQVDYAALSDETGKLINTVLTVVGALALWGIWASVLPAFRILDEVTLWHYSQVTEGAEELVPITLGNAILAVLIGIIGMIAAKRLPALLEIVLLARLNISAGSRYAIATLTQYAIVAGGVILLFNILGGSWSGIQWLIAALGVGIGFGLQEIVANFISGLILLFERPIRVGDVVTVGETDGVVTRIRIRSTTIRNWDQQELVVPNKEFVTGRLLNWTLTDPVIRIVIPIGIAYGSDVARALELIDQTAREHERVLDDPPVVVTFENFGDNALTMMLRCFVGSMEYRIPTTSELNLEINRKFEEEGIVVAFPQRDIHLDTARPLDVRIHPVEPASADPGEKSMLHPVSGMQTKPTGSA